MLKYAAYLVHCSEVLEQSLSSIGISTALEHSLCYKQFVGHKIPLDIMIDTMTTKTVTNDKYTGVLETISIPAQVHNQNGKLYATFGDVKPIHCCTPDEIQERNKATHHYCDIFTTDQLASLDDINFVRVDDTSVEKVFVNRSRKLLITSSDGKLAIWRNAPTFESNNSYLAGTPIVNKKGQLVSVVTAKKGNLYAVSSYEGEGGYFETTANWEVLKSDNIIYGRKTFASREELLKFVSSIQGPAGDIANYLPILHEAATPRICLIAQNDQQISHTYLPNAVTGAVYL